MDTCSKLVKVESLKLKVGGGSLIGSFQWVFNIDEYIFP